MYLTKNLSRGAILTLDGHTLSEVLSPSVSGGDCGGIVKVGILSIIGEITLGACPTIPSTRGPLTQTQKRPPESQDSTGGLFVYGGDGAVTGHVTSPDEGNTAEGFHLG